MASSDQEQDSGTGMTKEISPFASIEDALEDIRAGKMVIVSDDEDRENEGDLVMAAQFATPEAINFMVKEARGLVCLALTPDRCEQLGLSLMTAKNEAPLETAFTVSIEAASGSPPESPPTTRPTRSRSRSSRTPAPATSSCPDTSSR